MEGDKQIQNEKICKDRNIWRAADGFRGIKTGGLAVIRPIFKPHICSSKFNSGSSTLALKCPC